MMQTWFKKAKLGIFIHWGLYAVNGITESWPIAQGQMSRDEYYKQKDGFTAENYDPKEWAKLFKAAGANYAVLTTKHHDGFALFDTEFTNFNAVKASPAKRDLVKPYCDALREEGLKVGLYFTNTDWADDDHLRVITDKTQAGIDEMSKTPTQFNHYFDAPIPVGDNREELNECWQRFMTRYKGEIEELMTRHKPDVFWTDVMVYRDGFSWECEEVKNMIETLSPNTICNGRLGEYGDYENPEMYVPLRPLNEEWELCNTFNDSWGYQPNDKNYKNIRQIVRILCECISKGGNLLIGTGPDAKGDIPQEAKSLMLQLGEWTKKYAEAIYPTEKGLDPAYFLGGSTLSEDKKTLYLFSYDNSSEKLLLNGVRNNIKRITSLKNGQELSHIVGPGAPWINMPGLIWIDLPKSATDDVCTVIKIEFNEPIDIVDINSTVRSVGGA